MTQMAGSEDEPGESGGVIKALDPDVVNKIAAGEIIQRPSNALKEMIENAIDAGATAIEVLVRDGGLKLLQITDNGSGILREDLPVLCERFTTSKLKKFEDLSTIASYGFRGEALASISHVAHLTVVTKTREAKCAWRACYDIGRMVPGKGLTDNSPVPTAGRQGTQISVEDLFYNTPSRRRSFRNTGEEYTRIVDVVQRYAVHQSSIAFSCKKQGETSFSVSTGTKTDRKETIRTLYGSAVADSLLPYSSTNRQFGYNAEGFTSSASYESKRSTLLLFINNRLVESGRLKRGIESVYTRFLSRDSHPFVYLALEIEPSRVDVNVHPTKREVNFLYEDEIIQCICDDFTKLLSSFDSARSFKTHAMVPQMPKTPSNTVVKPYVKHMVRTDDKAQTLTAMLKRYNAGDERPAASDGQEGAPVAAPAKRTYQDICLTSVLDLREEVNEAVQVQSTEVIAHHTFVGIVDPTRGLAAIQHSVNLYLIDYLAASHAMFYQIGLTEFGNFGLLTFKQELGIRELLEMAYTDAEKLALPPDYIKEKAGILTQRSDMLSEYFQMEIDAELGTLKGLPLLLPAYKPEVGKLPNFLRRLTENVNWDEEKECFRTFLDELALFYSPPCLAAASIADDDDEANSDTTVMAKDVLQSVEHILFPAFKAHLLVTQDLVAGQRILQIASLPKLYSVFERC